ncbi:MMPL family transporter [Lactobacillus sp. Sy-1]|uniref:MMPL family transporter n=1 Tax=Lactobacillus sp. Sy-1 TaxID=2109645 RepID=UPI001C59FA0D|nr:MMPL family transporter [Lactobacillus sp. Sy-1]MBW1604882.1 MMPL family transporter [Lactobacillus sp. Sy-1]
MQLLKRINKNWLIVIVLWLVAVFFALTKLPNVSNLITEYGQPQYSQSSQVIKAEALQKSWGRGISNSTTFDVVYNNPNGKIGNQQQSQINKVIRKLQNNRTLGIKQISSINNNPNGKLQFFSNDQTTQVVKVTVDKGYLTSNSAINKLQEQVNVSGLNTYVTNPALIANENSQKFANTSKQIMMIAFIVAIVLMALFFRSIVAPIISAVTLLITELTALSLIGNLTIAKNFAFSELTPLLVTLITVVLGSIFNFMIIRAVSEEVATHRDSFNATSSGLRRVAYPIITISLVLAVSFAGLYFVPFYPLKALASLSIVFLILLVAVFTINPIFTSLMGPEIIWPRHNPLHVERHRLWHQLTRLSLWQPVVGIILVGYLVGPFAYSYRDNVTYGNLDDASSNDQAMIGARILQAHFSQGKAAPITIYIHNDEPLNQQDNLEKIDALTTKLKSVDNVNAVYSVTQPSGVPVNKYYVQSQLNSITKKIDQAQVSLTQTIKQANKGQQEIDPNGLDSEISTVSQLKSAASELLAENSQLSSQLSGTASRSNIANRRTTSRNLREYQNQVNELNRTISNASDSLSSIQAKGQQIASSSDSISTKLSKYASQLQEAKTIFSNISSATTAVNQKLNSIYDYLDGLAKSSVGAVYYITPTQLADTDFQQSLYNYNSANNKTTKLTVVLQSDPNDAKQTSKTIKDLQNTANVMLRGTALQNSTVAIAGQPAQQNDLQTNFVKYGLISLALIALFAILVIFIISRSILHPIYWVGSLALSLLASFQLTNLTTHYAMGIEQFSWETIIISMIALGMVTISEIIIIAINYRKRELPFFEFLGATFNDLGMIIRYFIGFTLVFGLVLFSSTGQVVKQSGIIISYGIIIFNLVFPILAIAFSKLAEQLPARHDN